MCAVRWLVPAALLVTGNLALADTRPQELRTLHGLIVIDTLSGLGESVAVDGSHIEDLLRGGIPRDRLDVTLLTGKDVTAPKILDYYRNVKVGPGDGLLFFYAGHGATDPEKGHFFALQKLHTTPLSRSDLRQAMLARRPGLVVILTDCCSTRFKIGKKRKVTAIPGVANHLDPALRCLLFQHRGVVDVTAAAEGAAFGDDDEGGLFTRTLTGSIRRHAARLTTAPDKFVSWVELFHDVEQGTAREFAHWSRDQQARGEHVDQKTQKPRAFELPRDPTRPSLTVRNGTNRVVRYRCRWGNDGDWEQIAMAPLGGRLHLAPADRSGAETPLLNVEFDDGETAAFKVGKTYRFNQDLKKSRSFEHVEPDS